MTSATMSAAPSGEQIVVGVPRSKTRRAPLVIRVRKDDALGHVTTSVEALRDSSPLLSAHETLSRRQQLVLAVAAAVALIGLLLRTGATLTFFASVVTVAYASATAYRMLCVRRGLEQDNQGLVVVSDADARSVQEADLPPYTILVPAYREPEVVGRLLESLASLDYPRRKLQVLLLLETDDVETLKAVREAAPPAYVRVLVVPAFGPQTKPKACNYGLRFATGEIVTIYDAEDRPEPLQLRRAVVAFDRVGPHVVCLQAQLGYFNADQNRLTEWFTAEYVTWFRHFLPGLVSMGAPIPLGGTSNHMRTDVLLELGAWDPFNVTEDADLGMRLARAGYTTRVLASVTLEEANSDAVNWLKQRSRWYKGYLQTMLVHLREPGRLRRELGWRGMLGFLLFVGGTPILSMLNPVFWSLTIIWFVAEPAWIEALFPAPWYYFALASWLLGNAATVYTGVLSIRAAGRDELLLSALLVPFYWVLMAVAAIKAGVQLVRDPSFWEKTAHGLDDQTTAAAKLRAAPEVAGAAA